MRAETILRFLLLGPIALALFVACSKPVAEVPDFDSSKADPMNGWQHESPAHHPEIYRPFIEHHYTDKELPTLLARLPYESISLRRTPCYGTCPVYEVVFHRDGRAEYHAEKDVPKVGEFTGRIYPGEFARLCYLIQSSGFEGFRAKYEAGWTDDATCIVTVTKTDASTKSVSDYGGVGPIQLWAIQQLLDGVKSRTWQPSK